MKHWREQQQDRSAWRKSNKKKMWKTYTSRQWKNRTLAYLVADQYESNYSTTWLDYKYILFLSLHAYFLPGVPIDFPVRIQQLNATTSAQYNNAMLSRVRKLKQWKITLENKVQYRWSSINLLPWCQCAPIT